MGNEFFSNHPMLGSVFDFNHDGSMSLGEAGAMGAFGAMYATELMRAAEESESGWSYDPPSKKKAKQKSEARDFDFDDDYVEYDETRVFDVDTSDAGEVMEAVQSGDFDQAYIEYLVHEALVDGVEFDADEAEEILGLIRERELREWVEGFLD